MEWLSNVLGSLGGSSLQSSGEISRETLMAFFEKGRLLFDSKDFCMHLRHGHERGESCELLVNAGQKQIFESLGVHGDYGLSYLARIQSLFANDSEMLRVFWAFVQLEEKTLDEAELDESEYREKYNKLEAMKLKMAQAEQELMALPEEERNAKMALMMQQMVEASLAEADSKCCANEGHCEHSAKAGSSSSNKQQEGLKVGGPMAPADQQELMSEEEKLKFFQSLAGSK